MKLQSTIFSICSILIIASGPCFAGNWALTSAYEDNEDNALSLKDFPKVCVQAIDAQCEEDKSDGSIVFGYNYDLYLIRFPSMNRVESFRTQIGYQYNGGGNLNTGLFGLLVFPEIINNQALKINNRDETYKRCERARKALENKLCAKLPPQQPKISEPVLIMKGSDNSDLNDSLTAE
jgi:hypothetical protein